MATVIDEIRDGRFAILRANRQTKSVYLGRNQYRELMTSIEMTPILHRDYFDNRKIFNIPLYVVDVDDHFEITAR